MLLKIWCNQGISLEDVIQEIKNTTTLEGLRHLYQKYESLKQEIKPLIIQRKSEIENNFQIIDNKEIINPAPVHSTG